MSPVRHLMLLPPSQTPTIITLASCWEYFTIFVSADNLDIPVVKPNLHMVGELFLNSVGAFCFDIVLGISFVSVLISYALAGSQAFANILGFNRIAMIPVFCFILTVVVVFLQFLVQPVISILTLLKGYDMSCVFQKTRQSEE